MRQFLNQLQSRLVVSSGGVAALWRWWRSEMEGLIEDAFGSRLARSRARLLIGRESVCLQLRAGRDWTGIAVLPRPEAPEALAQALSGLMQQAPQDLREVELRVPDDRILQRVLDLPAAVRPRMRQAVEYQLERLTPFRTDDIRFDVIEEALEDRDGRVGARLAIATRRDIDTWIAAVDPAGQLDVIVTGATPAGFPSFRFVRRHGSRPLNLARRVELSLAATLGVLALVVVGTAAWRDAASQRMIDARLDALRNQAQQAEETRATLEQRLRQAAFLQQQLTSADAAQVLSAITRDLPADSWIFQLQQDGAGITLSGFARNASAIAADLQKDPLFSQAQLRSASQQPGSDKERFEIMLALKPGGHTTGSTP